MGSHNIVTEHVVETQLFASTECFTFDLVSCSLGCTVIPGLKLASRLNFWGWITGEIVPLSLQTVRLLHPFLVKVMWQDSCQGGKLMTVSVSPSSPTTVDLRQWQMLTSPFTGNSVWSTTHWCNPLTDDDDDDDDAVAATLRHPRKCSSLEFMNRFYQIHHSPSEDMFTFIFNVPLELGPKVRRTEKRSNALRNWCVWQKAFHLEVLKGTENRRKVKAKRFCFSTEFLLLAMCWTKTQPELKIKEKESEENKNSLAKKTHTHAVES